MRLSRRRRECCRVASCPAQASPASLPCPCPVPQVGWPHKNVVRELLRKPDGVSIVLKKVPVPESPPQVHATQPSPASPAAFRPPVCCQLHHHVSACSSDPSSGPGLRTPSEPITGSTPAVSQVMGSALGGVHPGR